MSKDPTIRAVDLSALQCRDNRCHWTRVWDLDEKHPLYWGTYRYDRCVNCGNVKRRIEGSDGSVFSDTTSYEYDPRYEEALEFSREDARVELRRRERDQDRKRSTGGTTRGGLRSVAS